jgi:hypothetical protein
MSYWLNVPVLAMAAPTTIGVLDFAFDDSVDDDDSPPPHALNASVVARAAVPKMRRFIFRSSPGAMSSV